MMPEHDRPIGVFDSGVGGLTVLRALRDALPDRSMLYLGDTARVPYGTKSRLSIERYAIQAAQALISRDVDALVVACNTASAVALEVLRERFAEIPIVGVIEPGAQAACAATRNRHIAVIATESTTRGGAYESAIRRILPDATVTVAACPLFVALAEEGWVDGPLVEAIVSRYLEPIIELPSATRPDTLVLGCTHFPLLENAIRRVTRGQVSLVDSARTTAAVTRELLGGSRGGEAAGPTSHLRFLVTDGPDRFRELGARFFGEPIGPEAVDLVDL